MVTRPTLEQHLVEDPRFAFELLAKVIWRARCRSQPEADGAERRVWPPEGAA
jgi:hypothetical protein